MITLSHIFAFWLCCCAFFIVGVFLLTISRELVLRIKERKLRNSAAQTSSDLITRPSKQGGWVSGELVLWLWGGGILLFLITWVREQRYPPPPVMQTVGGAILAILIFAVAAMLTFIWGVAALVRAFA